MFINLQFGYLSFHNLKISGFNNSPPKIKYLTFNLKSDRNINFSKILNAVGVRFRTVTLLSSRILIKFNGSLASSLEIITKRPPFNKAPYISHTEKSKQKEWNIVHTS